MSICALAPDVCFHFCRTAAMSTSDVLFLLGFGLHFWLLVFLLVITLSTTTEGDATHDNGIDVVASKGLFVIFHL